MDKRVFRFKRGIFRAIVWGIVLLFCLLNLYAFFGNGIASLKIRADGELIGIEKGIAVGTRMGYWYATHGERGKIRNAVAAKYLMELRGYAETPGFLPVEQRDILSVWIEDAGR